MTHFSLLDYTLFGLYLATSVGVGLWSAQRKAGNLGDYFLAGSASSAVRSSDSSSSACSRNAPTPGVALIGSLAGFLSLLSLHLYQSGIFTAEKPASLVSFLWFSFFGCLITIAFGLAASHGRKAVTGS